MGVILKITRIYFSFQVVVLSACVVLGLAQDYEYSINQDKVSFRQSPGLSQAPVQRKPTFQPSSFQRAQPLQTAELSKYNSIPQIKIDPQPQQPAQAYNENSYDNGQYHEPNFPASPTPTRFQGKPVSFRPAAGSTYVPVPNTQRFVPQQSQNTFSQLPAQNDGSDFAPAPIQQASPQKFQQSSFETPVAPVRRPAKRPSASVAPLSTQSADDLAIIQQQNANAKYAFASNLENSIHDNALQRQEVRDGLALRGMYSYSDGFFKRTVQYEADENGYRVIK